MNRDAMIASAVAKIQHDHPGWFTGPRYQDVPGLPEQGQRACDLRWQMMKHAYNFQGKAILDIGCCEGWFSREAWFDGACPVLGIDREPGHIEIARRLAAAVGAGCQYVVADFATYNPNHPHKIEPWETVLFLSMLHYWPIPERQGILNRLASLVGSVMFFEAEEGPHEMGTQPWESMREMILAAGFTSVTVLGITERDRKLALCTIGQS